jgi:hypothetical protein
MVFEQINRIAQWGIVALLGVFAVTAGVQIASESANEQAVTSAFIPPAELANASIGAGFTTTLPPTSSVTTPATTTTTQIETNSTSTSIPEPSSTTSVTTASTTTTISPPPTTTTSTPPPSTTTTTTIAKVTALFIDGFSGKASSGDDGWEVEFVISLGATVDGSERASVVVTWSGSTVGQRVVTTGGSGTAQFTVGSFNGASVTFAITSVKPLVSGWEYAPELNTASAALTVVAPTDG